MSVPAKATFSVLPSVQKLNKNVAVTKNPIIVNHAVRFILLGFSFGSVFNFVVLLYTTSNIMTRTINIVSTVSGKNCWTESLICAAKSELKVSFIVVEICNFY